MCKELNTQIYELCIAHIRFRCSEVKKSKCIWYNPIEGLIFTTNICKFRQKKNNKNKIQLKFQSQIQAFKCKNAQLCILFCTEGIFNHDFLFHIFNIVKTGALRSFDKFSRNVNDISVLEYCLMFQRIMILIKQFKYYFHTSRHIGIHIGLCILYNDIKTTLHSTFCTIGVLAPHLCTHYVDLAAGQRMQYNRTNFMEVTLFSILLIM